MPLRHRSDGTPSESLSAERRLMPLLMRSRAESVVFAEEELDLSRTLPYLESFGEPAERPTLFHLVLSALAETFHERPGLNRFVSGGRVYDRRGVQLSFSAKRAFDDSGAIATVKLEMPRGEGLRGLGLRIREALGEVRTGRERAIDREVSLVSRIPPWLLGPSVRAVRGLDALNLLPASFIAGDPLYASAFVANLGSVGVRRAYHHLYEYGTVSVFVTLGAIERRVVLNEQGAPEARPMATLTFTFDERVHDGLYAARALAALRRRIEDPGTLPG